MTTLIRYYADIIRHYELCGRTQRNYSFTTIESQIGRHSNVLQLLLRLFMRQYTVTHWKVFHTTSIHGQDRCETSQLTHRLQVWCATLQCCRPLWSDLQCRSGICWWWSSCWLPGYDHPPSAFHSGPQDCCQWSDLFYEAWPHMCFRLNDHRRMHVYHTSEQEKIQKETGLGDKERWNDKHKPKCTELAELMSMIVWKEFIRQIWIKLKIQFLNCKLLKTNFLSASKLILLSTNYVFQVCIQP